MIMINCPCSILFELFIEERVQIKKIYDYDYNNDNRSKTIINIISKRGNEFDALHTKNYRVSIQKKTSKQMTRDKHEQCSHDK